MIFKQINRLQQLDQLIRQKQTGNAEILAKKLGISRRQTYNWLDELKSLGLQIEYNRQKQSFIYLKPYQVKFNIEIKELTKEETRKINAGKNFSKINVIVL